MSKSRQRSEPPKLPYIGTTNTIFHPIYGLIPSNCLFIYDDVCDQLKRYDSRKQWTKIRKKCEHHSYRPIQPYFRNDRFYMTLTNVIAFVDQTASEATAFHTFRAHKTGQESRFFFCFFFSRLDPRKQWTKHQWKKKLDFFISSHFAEWAVKALAGWINGLFHSTTTRRSKTKM